MVPHPIWGLEYMQQQGITDCAAVAGESARNASQQAGQTSWSVTQRIQEGNVPLICTDSSFLLCLPEHQSTLVKACFVVD